MDEIEADVGLLLARTQHQLRTSEEQVILLEEQVANMRMQYNILQERREEASEETIAKLRNLLQQVSDIVG